MKTVGERLVEGLAARGVEVIFGIPGVHTVELYRGLSGSSVRHVTARHEQGCVFMADGYARVSGKPGVACVITGPGLLNALTAMGQARADSIPLLVISGVNRRESLGKGLGLLHELPDQQAMVAPLCHTERIEDPSQVGPALDRAFAAMTGARPAPAHIEVPTDVMPMPCPALPVPAAPAATQDIPADLLAAAGRRLAAAKAPVILAGGGAKHAGAALQALAERLDAPVVTTTNARGIMHRHPLLVPAAPSMRAIHALLAGADEVLAVGTEFGQTDYDMYATGVMPVPPGVIRIDISAEQLSRHPAGLAIRADAETALSLLAAGLGPQNGTGTGPGAPRAAAARTAARAELAEWDAAMPARLDMVEAIRAALPGAIVVGDSTQAIYAANLYYDHDRPCGWFNAATGFGALGFAPGAAVGAAIAAPDAAVVCLIGDGGLQFSPGELRTAVDEKLPITYVVWNNAGFREIAEAMRGANTEVIGCTPSPLNMEPFAAACDLPFASIPQDPEALAEALRRPHTGPRMIEVRVR